MKRPLEGKPARMQVKAQTEFEYDYTFLDDDSDKPAASRVAKSRLQAFLDQTQGALNTFG